MKKSQNHGLEGLQDDKEGLEGYKKTDVGVIPDDWEVVKLSAVSWKIQDGTHFSPKVSNGSYRYITSKNIKVGYIDLKECAWISEEEHNKIYARCDVKYNDVLLTKDGVNTGNAAINYLNEPFSLLSSVAFIRPINNILNARFLLDYILSPSGHQRLIDMMTGLAITRLTLNKIKDFKIPLPPLAEQKAIAQSLSDVDALITECDRIITKKRNTKQGTMQQLLTGKKRLPGFSGEWEVKNLGEIGDCIIGLTYKPENVKENGLLVLRSSNIGDNQLKFDDNVFVDVAVPEKLITKQGDILICVRNGSRQLIGKNAIIDKDSEGFTFGAFMSVYRTKFYKYVFHAFQSNSIKRQIHENIGATINQITNKNLNSFQILLPPLEEQQAIAQILSDMDAEIEGLEQKRDKYKAIKQGMMQELLIGKTRLISSS
ncbi:restriction endonuclease subunit S [Nostoc cycadae]|uniref:Restriction endonuclease n=1 Tax=Nostoc cycadae WK-1 TaxID=1861711 RepID=A0A2H6LIX8_9NOSO|nr:restriction endonuclease subunit S [Nostoc cycadae]GBE93161.1 restriction endonuclease [Nostoc cycadae WK-1]